MYICICTVYIYTYIYTYTSKSSISLSLLVLPSPFSRVKLKPVFFVKICVLLGSISFRPFSFPEWTPPWFFASTSLRVDHSQTTLHNSTVNGSLNNFQKQLPKNRAVEGFLNSRDRYSVMFTDVKTVPLRQELASSRTWSQRIFQRLFSC